MNLEHLIQIIAGIAVASFVAGVLVMGIFCVVVFVILSAHAKAEFAEGKADLFKKAALAAALAGLFANFAKKEERPHE